MKNYFIIEGPVPPKFFFDRKEELWTFKRELELEKYKVLISIIAPFRFGKTSLLYAYMDIAKKFERIINIYLPLKTVDNPLSVIIKSLSEKLPEIKNISCKEGLYFFFKNVNAILEKKDLWVILYIDEFQLLPDRIRKEGFLTNWDNKGHFYVL